MSETDSEKPAESKYCRSCGKPLIANAKFCQSCGTPVTEPARKEENKDGRKTTEPTHTKSIFEDTMPLTLGYSLLTLGLVIVGFAVVLALEFLMGYMAPPNPYPIAPSTGPLGDITSAFVHVANVLFMS